MTTRHNIWDDQAEAYQVYFEDTDDRISSTQVFPRILDILGDVKGKRILDFGCGQGRFSRAFHDLGAEVTAYDMSSEEIEIALSLDNDRGIRYSSDTKILKNRSCHDLAFCFMVLLCNPPEDALKLVQDIFNYLIPGGRACFVNTNTEKLDYQGKDFF